MEYLGVKTVIVTFGLFSSALAWSNYKKYKVQKTIYAFCETRRRLIDLLHRNEIEIDSPIFMFHYKILNHLIHYSNDFRFNNKEFIEILKQDERELERHAFLQELKAEIEGLKGESREVIHGFYTDIVKAFWRHSLLSKVVVVGWITAALSQAVSDDYKFYTNAKDFRAATA